MIGSEKDITKSELMEKIAVCRFQKIFVRKSGAGGKTTVGYEPEIQLLLGLVACFLLSLPNVTVTVAVAIAELLLPLLLAVAAAIATSHHRHYIMLLLLQLLLPVGFFFSVATPSIYPEMILHWLITNAYDAMIILPTPSTMLIKYLSKKYFVERDNAPISAASLILISRAVAPIPVEGFPVWWHYWEPVSSLPPNLQPRTSFPQHPAESRPLHSPATDSTPFLQPATRSRCLHPSSRALITS